MTTVARAGAVPVTAAGARVFALTPEGRWRSQVPVGELKSALEDPAVPLWIDLDASDPAQASLLTDAFDFHPRAVEASLNPETRVTIEEFDDYLFVVVRAISFCEETEDDPYDLETANISVFLGRSYVLTVRRESLPVLDQIAAELGRSPALLAAGPARMAHAIIEGTVDEFFPLIDRIEEFVDGLEERVFVKFDHAVMHDIFSVKRVVLELRRHLAPEREVVSRLANRASAIVPGDAQLYFRGTYDRILRLTDALDTYRDLLSSTLESFLTQISNRLGNITKTLSVVATLSLPFVVVSGMWGMNFTRIPLAGHVNGFWILFGLQIAFAGTLLLVLRRTRSL